MNKSEYMEKISAVFKQNRDLEDFKNSNVLKVEEEKMFSFLFYKLNL